MKERPILFSGPMIRALLDGRKTQTRRVMKPQPHHSPVGQMVNLGGPDWAMDDGDLSGQWRCPYGVPGDRLWVKETYQVEPSGLGPVRVFYPSDDGDLNVDLTGKPDLIEQADRLMTEPDVCRPSIHMPRWASRLTLEITDIRVQRLHEISEADAIAEGADQYASSTKLRRDRAYDPSLNGIYREGFSELWEAINGAGSWAANPWVWAVSFAVINPEVGR